MRGQGARAEARNRMVKIAFGTAALVCLATGIIVYLFAEPLGFSDDTAQIVALAFLAAGVVDYIILRLWDRIMAGR